MTMVERAPGRPGGPVVDDRVRVEAAAGGRRRTSRSEDLWFLFFGLWTMAGLCLDGWAHRYQPELETFFTPWHAVFYSGFLAGASWLAFIVVRGRAAAPSLWAAVPVGYPPAVLGLTVFAVGGVGDAIWHSVFGIESSIDALLSPTHLLMLVGMLAAVTAPYRAAAGEGGLRPSLGAVLAPVLSLTITATAIAFFFLYANGFSAWPATDPLTESGDSQVLAALGVLSIVVSTVIVLTPVMVLLQRWRPPVGACTLLFTLVGVFMAGLDAFANWWQIAAPVVGGVTADLVIRWRSARGDSTPVTARWCGAGVPLVMWSVSMAMTHTYWGVRWPPELWVGSIVMAAIVGTGLALVTHPTER